MIRIGNTISSVVKGITVDFTITLTEEELEDTEFTSEEEINDAWEEVEDEIWCENCKTWHAPRDESATPTIK